MFWNIGAFLLLLATRVASTRHSLPLVEKSEESYEINPVFLMQL